MVEYKYKGFYIHYTIKCVDTRKQIYKADAHISRENEIVAKKFHTENVSQHLVEQDITKLIKDYIDFEWAEYSRGRNSSKIQ